MNEKSYNIIAFDAQYLLHRNFSMMKKQYAISMADCVDSSEGNSTESHIIYKYEIDVQELVKKVVYSIVKVVRDGFPCNKVILLWDLPPYHKLKWIPDFKGDRIHHNQEYLDSFDPETDPQGYLQEREEVRVEKIKNLAKFFIIDNLSKIGLPSISMIGYEADDLAYIFSQLVEKYDKSDLKSAICSVDSDWMYWISNKVDWIKHTTYEVWTMQDALNDCEGKCEKYGMSIFQMKQLIDSTFYSHNGIGRITNLTWKNIDQLITNLKVKNFSDILDFDQYKNNMKSFEIWNYPQYEAVKGDILNEMMNPVRYDVDNYNKLRSSGFTVSQSYIERFIDLLK